MQVIVERHYMWGLRVWEVGTRMYAAIRSHAQLLHAMLEIPLLFDGQKFGDCGVIVGDLGSA